MPFADYAIDFLRAIITPLRYFAIFIIITPLPLLPAPAFIAADTPFIIIIDIIATLIRH